MWAVEVGAGELKARHSDAHWQARRRVGVRFSARGSSSVR